MEYHSLIMGCHLTAQIHYFPQIYRQCSPHHHQHVMDAFYLEVFGLWFTHGRTLADMDRSQLHKGFAESFSFMVSWTQNPVVGKCCETCFKGKKRRWPQSLAIILSLASYVLEFGPHNSGTLLEFMWDPIGWTSKETSGIKFHPIKTCCLTRHRVLHEKHCAGACWNFFKFKFILRFLQIQSK